MAYAVGLARILETLRWSRKIGRVRSIQSGGKERLSVADITAILINLTTVKDQDVLLTAYDLLDRLEKDQNKQLYDKESFLLVAKRIIKAFDAIVPYEECCSRIVVDMIPYLPEIRANNEIVPYECPEKEQ